MNLSRDTFSDVDKLVSQGRLAEAADLLETALSGSSPTAGVDDTGAVMPQWLKLAGLRRALRQPRRALDCVHRALELAPYHFMALVMRAGLLERLEDPGAGEAWAEAIAHKPDTELPPPLAAALEAGEAFHAAWQERRAVRLDKAARDGLASARDTGAVDADADAQWRIARFRDNVLRRTRVYHSSPTHFHYPGLVEREFHPRRSVPWLAEIEAGFEEIRAEMQGLLQSRRAELVPYIQYEEREALEQWRALNRNPDWSAIHLIRQGEIVPANAALVPRTMEILGRVPRPEVPGASPNAMFSLLAPQTAIPPHVGVDNTRLVCHLPLVVPPGCWFRVGAETREWREGEAFAFDDTIEHEAMNPTDSLRVVLIFDTWHPDLTPSERAAVAAMIATEARA